MCIVAIILQQVSRFGLPTMIWSSEKVQRWILDHGDHEESDTRTMVHLTQVVQNGCKKVVLSTVDSDAVVISIYAFSVLCQEHPDLQFWVIVGPPKKQSVYHIGQIFENLGEQKCKALPFFTAFTGCDTTSQFVNKGKLSAWNAWMAYPQAADAFLIEPFEEIETSTERFEIIERYVCILYNHTTAQTSINKFRELLFSKKSFLCYLQLKLPYFNTCVVLFISQVFG